MKHPFKFAPAHHGHHRPDSCSERTEVPIIERLVPAFEFLRTAVGRENARLSILAGRASDEVRQGLRLHIGSGRSGFELVAIKVRKIGMRPCRPRRQRMELRKGGRQHQADLDPADRFVHRSPQHGKSSGKLSWHSGALPIRTTDDPIGPMQ